jgi:hypothetical protein
MNRRDFDNIVQYTALLVLGIAGLALIVYLVAK